MFTIVKKEPIIEPVALDDVKLYIKIQHNEEDGLLLQLISSARESFERFINKSLAVKTLILECDEYDFDENNIIELPFYPIVEIVSIKQTDDEGNTIATGFYKEIGKAKNSIKIDTVSNLTFEIEYTCGYSQAPQVIKLLLLKQIFDWYENRGDNKLSPLIRKELYNFSTDGAF